MPLYLNHAVRKICASVSKSGTFLARRYEKVLEKELQNKISGKTNVPSHTVRSKKILKNGSRRRIFELNDYNNITQQNY